ncbi:SpoIVB peptidase [Alkalibacillus haloalkaliphilus]|uniref:SpoIVB peptidase n=1 Tax=Alkalibacillus haloalkaliphilus TaxID=94136 RepID=A0A511W2M8_9BACI|nr:SpoIVB peptidase [Alkalibacillus haloalkaliphilus]GEN45270.1 SpoIVB peptidase [Alkalibacillus haloalkaliphilus]
MSRSRITLKIILLVSFVLPFTLTYHVAAETLQPVEEIIPGGQSIGVKLHTSGVVVVGFSPVSTNEGKTSPAEESGVEIGDIILQLNQHKINDMQSFTKLIQKYETEQEPIELLIKRQEHIFPLTVKPLADEGEDVYKLGLFIRDATAGIGTMTFYDPESKRYGALGHVITDQQTKKPLDIYNGKIVPSKITSINKGESGSPGEKRARFSMDDTSLGTIQKNTDYGIFGKLEDDSLFVNDHVGLLPVAKAHEVKEGKAKILTVVEEDTIEEFEIEIVSSVPSQNPETKGMVIQITDDDLLEASGGIVQGMSGSPIIQDGKLIGAVTHVFLNDPTSGYGVHIEWMLNEAGLKIKEDEEMQDAS